MKLIAVFIMSCYASAHAASWPAVVELANEVTLSEAPLDFGPFLSRLNNTKPVDQRTKLKQLSDRLKQVKPQSACQRWAFDALSHGIRAQGLFEQLHRAWYGSKVSYAGSLYALDAKGKWFEWLSLVWLGDSVTPDALYHVGEAGFDAAIKKLRQVAASPESGEQEVLDVNDDASIQLAYQATARQMKKSFGDLFIDDMGFDQLKVARSLQGDDFPAPGYYDPDTQTMYYHPQGKHYHLAQVPWLYLHEGMPGHHYQHMKTNAQLSCEALGLKAEWLAYGRMAWVEGWAAYVETLGKALGVLDQPSSQYHVLKWEALRAMRVMIDVGIHHKGWSKQQAIEFWGQQFPEGRDEMEIAISRIQRWPMQVNTYVFGKYKIEQLKHQLMTAQGESFDLPQFHEQLLKFSGLTIRFITHFQSFQQEFFK